jgi:signal transduction histidine kinase
MAPALSQRLPTSETRVLEMLSHGAPMMEVLKELCDFIGAKSPGVIPTVLLPDGDGKHLRLAAGPKVPEIWSQALGGLKVSSHANLHSTAGHQEQSAAAADAGRGSSLATFPELALELGVEAVWSWPILSRNRKILGTLILFYPTPQPPGERDVELIQRAVHIAAIAIECHRSEEELREFSRRLYQSQDQERRRIARELHDSTGQKLAVLGINLSTLKGAVPSPPPEFNRTLLECSSLAHSISDELRTLSYLLHPPMLDELGLNMAIRMYVSGINQRNGLHVEVNVPRELPRLSEDAELAIFRIVQASLTNVHLHSGAGEAKIRIEQNVDGVIATVSDDGQGMPDGVLDHSSRTKTIGIGITGMRERVEQLGGHLEIETSHNGTKVKATVPKRHFRASAAASAD